jgi:hypothetical protein
MTFVVQRSFANFGARQWEGREVLPLLRRLRVKKWVGEERQQRDTAEPRFKVRW